MKSKLQITNIACIGGGVIGAGWLARLVENGFNVSVFDKHENIKKKNKSTLKNAKIAFNNLTIFSRPKKGKIAYETSLKNAVKMQHYKFMTTIFKFILPSVFQNIQRVVF